eukprot:jgi/Mesen1/5789/ME000293S04944
MLSRIQRLQANTTAQQQQLLQVALLVEDLQQKLAAQEALARETSLRLDERLQQERQVPVVPAAAADAGKEAAEVVQRLEQRLREVEERRQEEHMGAVNQKRIDDARLKAAWMRKPATRHRVIVGEDPQQWRQRSFQHYPIYGLIKYSGYRVSLSEIAVVGMASSLLRSSRQLEGCEWLDNDRDAQAGGGSSSNIKGDLEFLFMGDQHYLHYEPVVMRCHLARPTGRGGGYMVGVIDGARFLLYAERDPPVMDVPAPDAFPHQLAFCSPRIYGAFDGARVREWFEYTRAVLRPDVWYLYDMGPVAGELLPALLSAPGGGGNAGGAGATIDERQLVVTDFRDGLGYDVTRFTARWAFVADFDEYIEFVPPHTLASLLAQHADKAWLTHQVMPWDTERCAPPPTSHAADADNGRDENGSGSGSGSGSDHGAGLWALERMVFKRANGSCNCPPAYPDGCEDPDHCLIGSWREAEGLAPEFERGEKNRSGEVCVFWTRITALGLHFRSGPWGAGSGWSVRVL